MKDEPLARQQTENVCGDCGAVVPGGSAGCRACFHQVSARAYSDMRYGAVHRLTVDTYALQHPEPYCHSAKSLAAHLTGLCCAMEYDASPDIYRATQKWLNGPRVFERPEPPNFRGRMTLVDVERGRDDSERLARVQEWARVVWEAWGEHHVIARQWIQFALQVQEK